MDKEGKNLQSKNKQVTLNDLDTQTITQTIIKDNTLEILHRKNTTSFTTELLHKVLHGYYTTYYTKSQLKLKFISYGTIPQYATHISR